MARARRNTRLRFPLDADAEALALGNLVFLDRALDRFLAGPAGDCERQSFGFALKDVHAQRGWITSLGFFMARPK
jgi:hypothetical protein